MIDSHVYRIRNINMIMYATIFNDIFVNYMTDNVDLRNN